MRLCGRRTVVPLVLAALLCAVPVHAADRLPGRLDDEAFQALVGEASEPGGTFRSGNLASNERLYQRVIPAARAAVAQGGVYLGVGPEQNFTYIAAFRPKLAFVIDIRRENTLLHLFYKALFELSRDRADFLSRLFARPRPSGLDVDTSVVDLFRAYCGMPTDRALFDRTLAEAVDLLVRGRGFVLTANDRAEIADAYALFRDFGPELRYDSRPDGSTTAVVTAPMDPSECRTIEAQMPAMRTGGPPPTYTQLMTFTDDEGQLWSYLAADDSYQFVRDLHLRNLIVPVTGDFAGPTAIRTVGHFLERHDAAVHVFYVSNVEQYLWQEAPVQLTPERARAFYRNAAALPRHDAAIFIRSGLGAIGQFWSRMDDTLTRVDDGSIQSVADLYR